jgi:hypothetical protein
VKSVGIFEPSLAPGAARRERRLRAAFAGGARGGPGPGARGAVVVLSGFLIVLVWFFLIPPSNDRDWQKDVAVLARANRR